MAEYHAEAPAIDFKQEMIEKLAPGTDPGENDCFHSMLTISIWK